MKTLYLKIILFSKTPLSFFSAFKCAIIYIIFNKLYISFMKKVKRGEEDDAEQLNGDRRVINIDRTATITVSFKSANESTDNDEEDEDEWEEKPTRHNTDQRKNRRESHNDDRDDARYFDNKFVVIGSIICSLFRFF